MRADLEPLVLSDLTRRLVGPAKRTTVSGAADLDDLFAEAKARAAGSDREAREAASVARAVLAVLDRHAGLLSGLAGGEGARTVERERGRWAELLDGARAHLAHGEPVTIYESPRRQRLD